MKAFSIKVKKLFKKNAKQDIIVGALTSLHFNVFPKKVWYAYSVSRTVYNKESQFLLVVSGTRTTYSHWNTKFSLKYFDLP